VLFGDGELRREQGLVWMGHIRGDPPFSLAAGYGFVLFSYFFRPACAPFIPPPFHMLLYAAYAGIVLPPFFTSSRRGLRRLGALLTLALIAAMAVFRTTVISDW
jgi:hypothetical protein